jgi:hypothetical protein
MSHQKKFSVRHGIEPEPNPSLEEAPLALRYFLLKYFEERYRGYPSMAAEVLEDFFHTPVLRRQFSSLHDPTVWERFYGLIAGFKWWEIYDLLEAIYKREKDDYKRQKFVEQVNSVLEKGNSPWRMEFYNGAVSYKGSEPFEISVKAAQSALLAAGRKTAAAEIQKALQDLSQRPHPDLTGAVQHAMAALECVAADVCGEKGETLGQIVKRHPDRFPPPIGSAVAMLYGFASEKGRHISKGGEPNLKEVELIVGIAATVSTYLNR